MRTTTLLITGSVLLIGALPHTQHRPTSQNDPQNLLFELGVQIGHAERDALEGESSQLLKRRLQFIRQLVSKIDDPTLTTEFDALTYRLSTSPNSRDVYLEIQLFRQRFNWRLQHSDVTSLNPVPVDGIEGEEGWVSEVPRSTSWEGVWETNWGTMTIIEHEHGRLTGNYGPSQHSIEGRVDPDDPRVFAGIWTHTGSTSMGRFRFEMTSRNSFEGAWTSGNNPPCEVGVNWTGTCRKIKEGIPNEDELPDEGTEGEFPSEGEVPDEPSE